MHKPVTAERRSDLQPWGWTMSDGTSDGFDAIVVGTGPGGATVARELTRRGARVVMLEWGPGGPVRGTAAQYIAQGLIPGRSLLLTNNLLGIVRGITTGGSSLFYYATAFPVPLDMLAAYGVDIADEVDEARRELPIGPLKDEMITPMTRRIMDSARELGFDWVKLDKFMDQDRWRPEHEFGYYGDPNGVKWSARMFVDEAVAGGATLINRARVTRVLVEGDNAVGVEYRHHGRTRRALASTVVVAAGGIGSPVILRASGIEEAGFDFFFDPLVTVAGTVTDVVTQHNEIPMSTGLLLKDEGYVMTDMAVPRLLHTVFTAQVGRIDKLFAYRTTARIMVKVRDALGGRITSSGGVRKKLGPDDRAKLRHGTANAVKILQNMGATSIHSSRYLAAHPGGTVKIGQIVDATLRTRLKNLYVCDCSVIPEPWGRPPTLTIIGLGKHLARCLAGEKSAS